MRIPKKLLAQKSKAAFDIALAAEQVSMKEYREVYRIVLEDYSAIVKDYKLDDGSYDFLRLRLDLSRDLSHNSESLLLLKIDNLTKGLAEREVKLVEQVLMDVFAENSSLLFYHVQKSIGYELELFKLSDETIRQLTRAKWTKDGSNYIERVAKGNQKLAKELKDIITNGITRGYSPRKTANLLRNATNSGLYNSQRIVRTETNAIITQSDQMTYERLGFKEYEFNAEYDDRTTEICGEMNGSKFPISEMTIGVNAPPMHPNCRSTIDPVSIIDYQPEFKYGKDGVGRPVKIDPNMSYRDFKKQYL